VSLVLEEQQSGSLCFIFRIEIHTGLCHELMMLYPSAHKGGHLTFASTDGSTLQREITGCAGKRIEVSSRATKGHPLHTKDGIGELFLNTEIAKGDILIACDTFATLNHRDNLIALSEIGEAILAPFDRHQESFTSEILKSIVKRTTSQKYSPPITFGCLDDVSMSGTCNRIRTIGIEMTLSQDRILVPCLERSPR